MSRINERQTESELEDGRGDDQLVFIPHEVDDMEMSPAAFRVYFHLVKTNRGGEVSSSYQAIGDKCFGSQHPKNDVTRRQRAIAAVNELIGLGLLKFA